jgi:hypothetical protein
VTGCTSLLPWRVDTVRTDSGIHLHSMKEFGMKST